MKMARIPMLQKRQKDRRAGMTVVAPSMNATMFVTLVTLTAIPAYESAFPKRSSRLSFNSSLVRFSYDWTRTNMSSMPMPSMRKGRTLWSWVNMRPQAEQTPRQKTLPRTIPESPEIMILFIQTTFFHLLTSNTEPDALLDTVELAQHDEDVEEHDGEAGVEEVVVAEDVLVDHVVEAAMDEDSDVKLLVAAGKIQEVFLQGFFKCYRCICHRCALN